MGLIFSHIRKGVVISRSRSKSPYRLISAAFEILRPGFILFGFSFQYAENDQLSVSLVGFFRETIDADFFEAVGEHFRNLAVQSPLRDEIDQNPLGSQVAYTVPEKGPLVPFGFFDITHPGGPVIGRIEPEKAECPVADPGILVIGDKTLI